MSYYDKNQIGYEERIDLIRVINDMWKGVRRFWFCILFLVIFMAGAAFTLSYVRYSPVYKASATFSVNNDESALYTTSSYQEERMALQIVNTFPYVLSSSLLNDMINDTLGTSAIPGSISVEVLGQTNMITMNVVSSSPEDAYRVLEAVIEHYPEAAEPVIGDVLLNMLDSTGIPEEPSNPPAFTKSAIKGALAGLAASVALLFLYAISKNTIYDESDFKKFTNIKCIGAIPRITFKRRGKSFDKTISIYNKKVPQSFQEAIRLLRARIIKDAEKNNRKVFLITSTVSGEGKSTIAANLAMSLAVNGAKVVLVDCDLHNPSVTYQLNMEADKGLCDLLKNKARVDDVFIWNPTYKMYVLPGGMSGDDAAELLDSPKMQMLLKHLRERVDYVILDTPPVGILSETAVLAESADAALFVVKQDCVSRGNILEAISQLSERSAHISGCILNNVQAGIGGYGYKDPRHYYGKGYYNYDQE